LEELIAEIQDSQVLSNKIRLGEQGRSFSASDYEKYFKDKDEFKGQFSFNINTGEYEYLGASMDNLRASIDALTAVELQKQIDSIEMQQQAGEIVKGIEAPLTEVIKVAKTEVVSATTEDVYNAEARAAVLNNRELIKQYITDQARVANSKLDYSYGGITKGRKDEVADAWLSYYKDNEEKMQEMVTYILSNSKYAS
jgi:hypothetical protein